MNTREFLILKRGIAQMDGEGVDRLRAHLEAKKPVLVNGEVYDEETGHG